jgi:effector-binding domain-containing protein
MYPWIKWGLIGCFWLTAAIASAAESEFVFKRIPQMDIVAVKVDPQKGYAPAFGELVQYYLQHPEAKVKFPQMSVEVAPDHYAAIAYTGVVHESGAVRIIRLPEAMVATAMYRGDYGGLPAEVRRDIAKLRDQGAVVDTTKVLRLLYMNSPDNTAPGELLTEIEIPVSPR